MTTTGLRNGSTAPPNVFRNIQLQMGELEILLILLIIIFGRVFVLGTLNGGGGGGGVQPPTTFLSASQSSMLKSGPSVQVPGLLSDIWVPSIISQKHWLESG